MIRRVCFACAILLSIALTVSGCFAKLEGIRIYPESCFMLIGGSQEFAAYGEYSNGDELLLNWANWSYQYEDGYGVADLYADSDNEGANASFYPGSPGKVTISAQLGDIRGSATIDVGYTPSCWVIYVNPDSWDMKVGEEKTFNAIGYDQWGFPMAIYPEWEIFGGLQGLLSPSSGCSTTFTAHSLGCGTLRVSYPPAYKDVLIKVEVSP